MDGAESAKPGLSRQRDRKDGRQVIMVNGRDGARHEIAPAAGRPLMWDLRRLKIGVVGLCNGNAACGTCHVFVRADWLERLPEPDEYEEDMLSELSCRSEGSRLACQVTYGPELDGLELTIAPRD
jgi:2Fe-2S ferredoxin